MTVGAGQEQPSRSRHLGMLVFRTWWDGALRDVKKMSIPNRDVNDTLAYETETSDFCHETKPTLQAYETETFLETFTFSIVPKQ